MGKCLQDCFAVNPLEDPIVKRTLEEVHMSGQQLIEISVKELNRRLAGCSSFVVIKLKKCRRTLKNRGYAKSCRIKRIVAKSELELVNARLLTELTELRQRNRSLAEQVHGLLSAAAGAGAATTTTTGGRNVSASSAKLALTVGQHQINRFYYDELRVADGPHAASNQHLLQHQHKRQQQHDVIFHQHTSPGDPVVHNTAAAYHGLGHHNHHNEQQQHSHPHPHQVGHSSGSSTCNSSPVSSSSSSMFAAGAADAACRSLEAELEFVLDDHHPGGQPPADVSTANCAIYNELPSACSWSMGQHQHQVEFH